MKRLLLPFQIISTAAMLAALAIFWPIRRWRELRRSLEVSHTIIEPYWKEIEARDDDVNWDEVLRRVPAKIIHLHAVHYSFWQVCNGGFYKFFWNPYGEYTPEARDGYQAIGMSEVANIIQSAMEKIGSPYQKCQIDRHDAIGPWENRSIDFDEEDSMFYRAMGLSRFAFMLNTRLEYLDLANDYAVRKDV